MAIIDYYPRALALDGDGNIVRNAESRVYALSDTQQSTPLTLLDMQGIPMAQLTAGATGIYPEFRTPGNIRQVIAVSLDGRLRTPMTSLYGLLLDVVPDPEGFNEGVEEVRQAQLEVEGARTDAVAAAQAAAAVGNTNDTIIEGRIKAIGSKTELALRDKFVAGVSAVGTGIDPTGVNDSTSAIQAKLQLASSLGAPLIVPPGTYLVDRIDVLAGQRIVGQPGAILRLKPGAARSALDIWDRASVEKLAVDGDAASQTDAAVALVRVRGEGATVRDLVVTRAKNLGILVNAGSVSLTGCRVTDSGSTGIFVIPPAAGASISRVNIIDCEVDRSSLGGSVVEGGIKVHRSGSGGGCSEVKVTSCTVRMPLNPTAAAAIAIELHTNTKNSLVQGCHTSGGAIGISYAAAESCSATGNVITSPRDYGIEFSNSKSCTASGNTVIGQGVASNGINCNSGTSYSSVSANTISGCKTSSIKIELSSDVSVVGNTVIATASQAVELLNSANCTVSGNVLDGSGTALKAVFLDTSFPATVSGNIVRRFTQGGVGVYAASAVVVDHIAVSGNTFLSTNGGIQPQLSNGASLGSNVKQIGNVGVADVFDVAGNVVIRTATGSPEGGSGGGVGSLYLRKNGAAGTTLYVKESGTGTAGWVAK